MYNKFEDFTGPVVANTNVLSFDELKQKITKYQQDCLVFRYMNGIKVDSFKNDLEELIPLYNWMIMEVNKQNSFYQNKLIGIEHYGIDGELLQLRINNTLFDQNKYLKGLKSQLSIAEHLLSLFPLNSSELFEEAKKNRSSALLIIQTPKLIAKIPDSQLKEITHQDKEIARALATTLLSREYTVEIAKIYTVLKQQFEDGPDKNFITDKENENIYKLLLKINNYLDKKIAQSLNETAHPWTLGYFGSGYKLIKDDKKIPVPQGIYELKTHLDQLGKVAPSQILAKIQTTLHAKQEEIRDESIWKQIQRFVSYILGYHRSKNTIQEYKHLDELTSGKQPA